MPRDKAKDDLMFNCKQEYERNQVAGHYGPNKQKVLDFLIASCQRGDIYNSTHKQVYELIQDKFGYDIPV